MLTTEVSVGSINVKYLKENYLTNLTFIGPDGCELPDWWYERFLSAAASELEERTGVSVFPKTYDEKHDFVDTDYANLSFKNLRHKPIWRVLSIMAQYAENKVITIYPSEWYSVNYDFGHVHLIPSAGTYTGLQIIGTVGAFAPFAFFSRFPNFYRVKYMTGFDNDCVPAMLVDALMMMAIVKIKLIAGEFIRPVGVKSESLSIDGGSQSRSYADTTFQALIGYYQKSLFGDPSANMPGLLDVIALNYRGIPMCSA